MNDENNVQVTQAIDTELLGQQFNKIATILADAYITRKNKPSVEEMFRVLGYSYEQGKLYVAHIQALQKLLIEEYEVMGLDLASEIIKNGEKFEVGKLSKYEAKVLTNKLQNVICLINQIKYIQEKRQETAGAFNI